MTINEAVPLRSTIPARLERLGKSPFHTRMVAGLGCRNNGGFSPQCRNLKTVQDRTALVALGPCVRNHHRAQPADRHRSSEEGNHERLPGDRRPRHEHHVLGDRLPVKLSIRRANRSGTLGSPRSSSRTFTSGTAASSFTAQKIQLSVRYETES
jgi:hypothetical protein